MKKLISRIKKLTFSQIIFLLLGFLSVLIVINLILNPSSGTGNQNVVITDPDAEGYRIRQENLPAVNLILPYEQEDYGLSRETKNGVEVINITYDRTDPRALEAAYLYLKQYGIIQGDGKTIETPRDPIELF
ncbi:MAG: hypothetical protein ABIM99_03195 [Candidatus Dojkabacteria bacterium]